MPIQLVLLAAYNHAEYWNERRHIMQWWSDFLDQCAMGKTGAEAVPIPE